MLPLKDLPRYECLLRAAERFPALEPSACEAFLNLLRTGHEVSQAAGRFYTRFELSPGGFTVLMLLGMREDSLAPGVLAAKAGVTRATMSGVLDTLQRDGLLSREPDCNDRRTIHVRLTPAGGALMEEILPEYFRCIAEILRPLEDGERTQFVRLLQKIQTGLAGPEAAAPEAAAAQD